MPNTISLTEAPDFLKGGLYDIYIWAASNANPNTKIEPVENERAKNHFE